MLILSILIPNIAFGNNFDDNTMPPPPPDRIHRHDKNHHFENMQNGDLPTSKEDLKKKKENFEKRLKLTSEQKAKTKELRKAGIKEMEPIINAMKAKQEEVKAIMNSKDYDRNDIYQIQRDVHKLQRKAHDIKMKNMKEFETILTEEQLKELQEMKKEGRKNFEEKQRECEKTDTCKKPDFASNGGRLIPLVKSIVDSNSLIR